MLSILTILQTCLFFFIKKNQTKKLTIYSSFITRVPFCQLSDTCHLQLWAWFQLRNINFFLTARYLYTRSVDISQDQTKIEISVISLICPGFFFINKIGQFPHDIYSTYKKNKKKHEVLFNHDSMQDKF